MGSSDGAGADEIRTPFPKTPPKGDPVALKDARLQTARRQLRGRRGSGISSAGSFSIGGGSNRSGND